MAITGEPYCKSAWNAMLINLKHLWKFYFANTVAGMFTTMGFLFITTVTLGSYFALIYMFGIAYDMHSLIGPVILMAVMCAFICHLFLGLFDEAVMGTLMSVAVDMDLNGVTNCQYGPEGLHKGLAKVYAAEKDTGVHGYGFAQGGAFDSNNNNLNDSQ